MQQTKTASIQISGLAHIGIRVHDLERSLRFYALLGFTKTLVPIGPKPVAILERPSGVEINLVLNAPKVRPLVPDLPGLDTVPHQRVDDAAFTDFVADVYPMKGSWAEVVAMAGRGGRRKTSVSP